MSGLKILDAWRQLLPRDVAISAGPLLDDLPALTPREEASAGTMDASRTVEFKTGRAYAKRALSRLGLHHVELPVGPNRAPVWPSGVSGSITHTAGLTRGHVAVAVARTDAVSSIGIDAEVSRALHHSTWAQFLVASELHDVRDLQMESRAGVVLIIWCVKEAATKALGEPIDPLDIAVHREGTLSAAHHVWRVAIQRDHAPIVFQARTVCLPELVLGAVFTRRGGNAEHWFAPISIK
jgi:4'-phosphopantetheinyl transferase EntD